MVTTLQLVGNGTKVTIPWLKQQFVFAD